MFTLLTQRNNMVTFEEDEFTFEKPRWIAHLSNGTKVLQDDNRPVAYPPQAWLRLADYCRHSGLYITNLTLQFRSHHQTPLPANADGYYFINKIMAIHGGPQFQAYVIGYLTDDNKVLTQTWLIPELIKIEEDARWVSDKDPCLIRR